MKANAMLLFPGLLFAGLFIWYTHRKRALTLGGAFVAALLGLWVLWFAGPLWLFPLFFFFISSTLLGRLNKKQPKAGDAKHGKPRDYWQVLCNGGIYALLATGISWLDDSTALALMSFSISVSIADTWSSEIGQYRGQETYDILRWTRVPVGLSGGVSIAGTLGGLAGALSMAFLCSLLLTSQLYTVFIVSASLAGFCGMLLDSVLGAGLQARFSDKKTGALSDVGGEKKIFKSGFYWMSNDAVNLWSNLITTTSCFLVF